MKLGKGSVCQLTSQRIWATFCLLLTAALILYYYPFLLLWWPQELVTVGDFLLHPPIGTSNYKPSVIVNFLLIKAASYLSLQKPTAVQLPLDMATDSIDDMYEGCRPETAARIDLFGVFEWHFNKDFSLAWASVERNAKRPVHKHLKEEHAIAIYIYTKVKNIQQDFNEAVKTGKDKYSTSRFKFHYFYFYLTEAVQVLHHNQTSCRTTYHRTWKQFDHNVINTKMRFGAFTWVASSKNSLKFNGNVSCFEIHSCFGADISFYSATDQMGQVLIPPYEVFKITDVLTNDPWCSVVYKLQSTKIPRRDLNCKLNDRKSYFGVVSTEWQAVSFVGGMMLACLILWIMIPLVFVKHRQKCFMAAVQGALLVLMIIVVMLGVTH